MGRVPFGVETGLRIYDTNSDTFTDRIQGSGAPGGDGGIQDAAPVMSLYSDYTNFKLYKKISTANNSVLDWEEIGGAVAMDQTFREECIRAVTTEVLAPGVRDLTASPFTDDEAPTLSAADFVVGDFVIGGQGTGSPLLLEVTAVSAPNITLATPSTAPALTAGNNFVAKNYLPDSPDDQEAQALIHYNGTDIVKLGDVNWNLATGIDLSATYSPASGDPVPGDSVEAAIEKLDGNIDALNTALGVAQGATDMGTYTGNIISDNVSQTTVNQELESAIEAISGGAAGNQTGITTATNVDCVLVDEVDSAEWEVLIISQANPANKRKVKVSSLHNGTPSADATSVDHDVFSKLKTGNFNAEIDVVLTGTGAAQQMCLEITASAAVDVYWRRTDLP